MPQEQNGLPLTDLDYIREAAKRKEKENSRFRTFLKARRATAETDSLVRQIAEEVSGQIDCMACANCCKKLMPAFTETEIDSLATHLDMNREAFVHTFLQFSAEEQTHFSLHSPCAFLKDNHCTIYALRPQSCRDYPNLHKPDFSYRMLGVLNNYGICPIVYNAVERLKVALAFDAAGT